MEHSPTPNKRELGTLDKISLYGKMDHIWDQYGKKELVETIVLDTTEGSDFTLHAEFWVNGTFISLEERSHELLELGATGPQKHTERFIRTATPITINNLTYWNIDQYDVDGAGHSHHLISISHDEDDPHPIRRYKVDKSQLFTHEEVVRIEEILDAIRPEHFSTDIPDLLANQDLWPKTTE